MTQALYAHMNNKRKKNYKKQIKLWFPKHRNRPNKKQAGVVP
jgi:hypothetical protein